jgi:hypothetical protein
MLKGKKIKTQTLKNPTGNTQNEISNTNVQTYRAFHNVLLDTKIYYRKTVRHILVFTKPVQIEGTNQSPPPPKSKFFSS